MALRGQVKQAVVLVRGENPHHGVVFDEIAVVEGNAVELGGVENVEQVHFAAVAFADERVDGVPLAQQQSRQMRPGKTSNSSDEIIHTPFQY